MVFCKHNTFLFCILDKSYGCSLGFWNKESCNCNIVESWPQTFFLPEFFDFWVLHHFQLLRNVEECDYLPYIVDKFLSNNLDLRNETTCHWDHKRWSIHTLDNKPILQLQLQIAPRPVSFGKVWQKSQDPWLFSWCQEKIGYHIQKNIPLRFYFHQKQSRNLFRSMEL